MRLCAATCLAIALLASLPAAAQLRPHPGPGDPRIQRVTYDPEQVVQLQAAPGYEMSIEFSPDERIENIAIGDSGGWQVTPNKRGDHLFIKATQPGITTNLTVITDARSYSFELTPAYGPMPNIPFVVRFEYPAAAVASKVGQPGSLPVIGRYRLSGSKRVRPDKMEDDGQHTYLSWAPDKSMPAVFAIDDHGKEVIVNGEMRDGRYVIDSTTRDYVFRLDDQLAHATRIKPRKKR